MTKEIKLRAKFNTMDGYLHAYFFGNHYVVEVTDKKGRKLLITEYLKEGGENDAGIRQAIRRVRQL
jgi:hypothetical protein